MLKVTLLIIVSFSVFSASFLDKIKGFVAKVTREEIVMPKIPKINSDPKSTSTYKLKSKVIKPPKNARDYDEVFLKEIVKVIQKRDITSDEFYNWLNALSSGASREGIYRALINDRYYISMEERKMMASSKLISETMSYAEKYLGIILSKSKLETLNEYSIKKYITEKTLDVFDSFESLNNSLKWYALFSKYIAIKNKGFKNKLRKSDDAHLHYKWANAVPLQYVKSEIIIKLFTCLNQYQ